MTIQIMFRMDNFKINVTILIKEKSVTFLFICNLFNDTIFADAIEVRIIKR